MIYKHGKELRLADALSKLFCDYFLVFFEGDNKVHVAMIIGNFSMSKHKKKIFQEETAKDEELQALLKCIKNGWTENQSQIVVLAKSKF